MYYIIQFIETGETKYKLFEQQELDCTIEELNRRGVHEYQIRKNEIPYVDFLKKINGIHLSSLALEMYFANSVGDFGVTSKTLYHPKSLDLSKALRICRKSSQLKYVM